MLARKLKPKARLLVDPIRFPLRNAWRAISPPCAYADRVPIADVVPKRLREADPGEELTHGKEVAAQEPKR